MGLKGVVAVLSVSLLFKVEGFRLSKRRQEIPDIGISIVNGTDAPPCTWPWQVGLYEPGGERPFCGGSLVDDDWVVTATHCVRGDGPYDIVGGDILPGKGQRRSSKRVFRQPGTDLALIHTESFEFQEGCLESIRLPARSPPMGGECWITGWGRIVGRGAPATTLQQAKTSIIPSWWCRIMHPYLRVQEGEICIRGTYNGRGTSGCQGDSGGPLACKILGSWILYGATSRGPRVCDGIGIWAGVHAGMDWITKTVRENRDNDQDH